MTFGILIMFPTQIKLIKSKLNWSSILKQNELTPRNTLFVDDKKANTDSAKALGIQVWNLQVGQEDVVDLFEIEVF